MTRRHAALTTCIPRSLHAAAPLYLSNVWDVVLYPRKLINLFNQIALLLVVGLRLLLDVRSCFPIHAWCVFDRFYPNSVSTFHGVVTYNYLEDSILSNWVSVDFVQSTSSLIRSYRAFEMWTRSYTVHGVITYISFNDSTLIMSIRIFSNRAYLSSTEFPECMDYTLVIANTTLCKSVQSFNWFIRLSLIICHITLWMVFPVCAHVRAVK